MINLLLIILVSLSFIGCGSHDSKTPTTVPSSGNTQNGNNNIPPTGTGTNTFPPNGNLSALNVLVLHHLDARDRYYDENFQGNGCLKTNRVAIRYPVQSISGRDVIDWDLKCREIGQGNFSQSSFSMDVNCSDLMLGNQIPHQIGIDKKNGTVTYFYKDLEDGNYAFTAYSSGQGGTPNSVERTTRFSICADADV